MSAGRGPTGWSQPNIAKPSNDPIAARRERRTMAPPGQRTEYCMIPGGPLALGGLHRGPGGREGWKIGAAGGREVTRDTGAPGMEGDPSHTSSGLLQPVDATHH